MPTADRTSNPLVVRARWVVLALAALFLVVAGMLGGDVADHLASGGFDDPSAESSRAAAFLADAFDAGPPNVVLVATAPGSVDGAAVAEEGLALTSALAGEPGVAEAASYWTLGGAPPLRSDDGTRALVLVRLDGDEDARLTLAGDLRERYAGAFGDLEVAVGGVDAVFDEVNEVIEEDLVTAEAIAFPLTLLLLIVVFGSVVAAFLPLAIGGFAIVGTFLVLRVIAGQTDVSIFALNFTTAMGLGLAIDYSLLVVSRYREELAAGFAPRAAVTRTVRTAGRTVVFSGLTVASALAALLVFRIYFLRSFAYAGIAVVGMAVLGAVVVLPALLAVLGENVNRWRVRKRLHPREDEEGVWHRVAMTVMRRPVPIATAVTLFLAALAGPFLGLRLGFPDDRVLHEGAETRQAGELVRTEFGSSEGGALSVVAPALDDPADVAADVDGYAARLSSLDGVARVDALTGTYVGGAQVAPATPFSARFATPDATYLSVVPAVEPFSLAGEELVAEVRATEAPFAVLVGGQSADLVDGKAALLADLPLAMAVIALVTFVVLFLQFGSVLVPVKAIVLNMLSLTAMFGAMVWIFQQGNLSGFLGFTATGTLATAMPVLMFCLAFGLSMDYEVFLLSRVKEEYDRTGDNVLSVARGLERTGRIVTAAAVLIAVVFFAFGTGRVSFMKMFGLGLTLAVLADAFLIRVTLVPAFMRLAGDANWWAPRWMRAVHARIGFTEHVVLDPPPGDAGTAGAAGAAQDGTAPVGATT